MEIKTVQKARTFLLIGLLGAILTLVGDLLIGYVRFPEGAGMLEGYFAAALALPVWRSILGGMIGFLGISLEFLGLMTVYPLLKQNMPRGAAFYKLSMYVYLAVAGGAVHLPCGVFMWLYHSVADAAGQAAGYDIALQYVLYFILPVSVVFYVFFAGSSIVQFVAIVQGKTPLPRWYAVFNLLIVFNPTATTLTTCNRTELMSQRTHLVSCCLLYTSIKLLSTAEDKAAPTLKCEFIKDNKFKDIACTLDPNAKKRFSLDNTVRQSGSR